MHSTFYSPSARKMQMVFRANLNICNSGSDLGRRFPSVMCTLTLRLMHFVTRSFRHGIGDMSVALRD